MNSIAFIVGLIILLSLLGGAVVLLLTASTQSERKLRKELQDRILARQPWDAQSADGRGNR